MTYPIHRLSIISMAIAWKFIGGQLIGGQGIGVVFLVAYLVKYEIL